MPSVMPAGHLDPRLSLTGSRVVSAIAQFGLVDEDVSVSYDDVRSEFEAIVDVCEEERLLGALAWFVVSEGWQLESNDVGTLTDRYVIWLARSLDVERLTVQIDRIFASEGIDYRIMKGVALSRIVYPDPSFRVFGDLDVLVRSTEIDRAVAVVCESLGGQRIEPSIRPGFTQEFGKDATLRIGDLELDIHRSFAAGPFGVSMIPDELFREKSPTEIGGVLVPALGPLGLLLSACFGASIGDYPRKPGPLRDLALLAERWPEHLPTVSDAAARWHVEAVVADAAAATIRVLGLPESHPLATLRALRPSLMQRLYLRTYQRPGRGYWRELAGVVAVPGVRPRARYAQALLLPSAGYLAKRGWTRGTYVRAVFSRMWGRGE